AVTATPGDAAPIFELGAEICDAFARRSPVLATFAGLPGQHDAWDDYGPDACASWDVTLADFERRLAALPPASDRSGRLAARVMSDWLTERRRAFAHGDHLCDLNSIDSSFQHILHVFEHMPAEEPMHVEALCQRLETIAVAYDGWFASLDEGARRG